VFALAFTFVTYFLGIFIQSFRPNEATFLDMYRGFLLIAAIYIFLATLGIGGLVGLIIMAVAYRYVFDATWVHALVIGVIGGIIGMFAWIYLLAFLVEHGFIAA